jgi:phosphoribosylaminoimidazole-succinocarboxamide synthase
MENVLVYSGKVREIYDMGKYLIMKASDRVSAFDKHIGTIEGKGELLNKMSAFWFDRTRHIVKNHLHSTNKEYAVVDKCVPIKIEFVVRGYITGNTQTSLWTHYERGDRKYCGITFPDGLKKNQRLERPVLTPTTKGAVDVPISRADIINGNLSENLSERDCDFIYRTCIALFEYGQTVANNAGFILVDTKYEFGRNYNGEIILIDELHTCDSSRYWVLDTYSERFGENKEPEKLDKDCIRDWVKKNCTDPYNEPIPDIPNELVARTISAYRTFYNTLKCENTNSTQLVVVISGSEKDYRHVKKITDELAGEGVPFVTYVSSAHKNTSDVLAIMNQYKNDVRKIVWVTVAGKSNALSGVVASNVNVPVIACPPFSDKTDMLVNIHSTLQCPQNVPVMTILDPRNVAVAIKRILTN